MKRNNMLFIEDILDCIDKIDKFVGDMTYEEFALDDKTSSAVVRKLEIIGEAARRVSQQFQDEHQEIPWRSIIGLRNILIHEYGEVKLDRVWLIASTYVPALVDQLQSLIPPVPGEE